jgi:hypothetical protein
MQQKICGMTCFISRDTLGYQFKFKTTAFSIKFKAPRGFACMDAMVVQSMLPHRPVAGLGYH